MEAKNIKAIPPVLTWELTAPTGGLLQMRNRGTLGPSVSQSQGANSAKPSISNDGPLEIRLPWSGRILGASIWGKL